MKIKPLRADLQQTLKRHQLERKFLKQQQLFESNHRHPSLHTEKLEPKSLNIYSFRVDKKWRVIFINIGAEEIEVVDINDHYDE